MCKRIVSLVMLVLLVCLVATAGAEEINFIDPGQFKVWLEGKKPMIIADIQKSNDFKKHHFFGAVATDAYPAKTVEDMVKLDVIKRMQEKTDTDVIIVGPRGGASARRSADYLIEQGVPAEKVFILEGGVKGWPNQEMLLDIAGGCA